MINQLKRIFLIVMLGLIGLTTVGCVAVLFLYPRGRTLESALLVAAALGFLFLMGMAAFLPLERGRWRPLALVGLACNALMVVLAPCIVVAESFDWLRPRSYPYTGVNWAEVLAEVLGTGLVLTGFFSLVPLVLMPRLKFPAALLQILTSAAMAFATIFILLIMWVRYVDRHMGDVGGAFLGASLIFSGAGALSVLVLARFFSIKSVEELTVVTQTLRVQCPRCLTDHEHLVGESRCPTCKLRFKIEVEEPRCPRCRYILTGLTRPQCPECGIALGPEDVPVPTVASPV